MGMKSYPVMWGFVKNDIRIPELNNQDSMESKARFFFVAHLEKNRFTYSKHSTQIFNILSLKLR